jgi:succinate dehydrogenase hydrophobic anchor subunit
MIVCVSLIAEKLRWSSAASIFSLILSIVVFIHAVQGLECVVQDYTHYSKIKMLCFFFIKVIQIQFLKNMYIFVYLGPLSWSFL